MRGTPILSRVVVFVLVVSGGWPSPTAAAPSFEVLGDFIPAGVSDDGNVVAGTGGDPALLRGLVIRRWTPSGGLQTAGFVPESEHTSAHAISGDGLTILGVDYNANMLVWTAAGGISYPAGTNGSPGAISRDGSVLGGGHVGGRPFRWTAASGAVPLPTPSGWGDGVSGDGRANALSADGLVAAGTLFGGGGFGRAFRWTSAGGSALLDQPAGIVSSHVGAISADGSTLIGSAYDTADVDHAFRWTEAGGFQLLGHLPGYPATEHVEVTSVATAATADGSIIFGNERLGSAAPGRVAFVWDATHGMRDLKAALSTDFGIQLPGWSLTSVAGVTPDGMTIVGAGSHAEFGNIVAWRVVLPEPTATVPLLAASCFMLRRRRRA